MYWCKISLISMPISLILCHNLTHTDFISWELCVTGLLRDGQACVLETPPSQLAPATARPTTIPQTCTASMEQLRSLPVKTLRTQLERCLLPTSGSNVTMAARLHNCFTPPKARHLWIPTMLWSHPKTQTDNNNKQQKPAHQLETTCFLSNLLINCHLQIICFLSNLRVSCQIMYTKVYMVQTPSQQSQAGQSNHRDQITYSNSQPVDASDQVPSTSNQLLGDNGEEELFEPSIIQPIGLNPVHHHTRQYCKFLHCCQTCGSNQPARIFPQAATSRASN